MCQNFLPVQDWIIFHHIYIYTTFCLSLDTWVVSTFWPWWIMLLQTWVYNHHFKSLHLTLWDIHQRVELLVHTVIPFFFFFWGTSILHSHSNAPFYIPTTRVLISSHSHGNLLLFFFFKVTILTGVSWYFTVSLICISLLVSDVEHLFVCLLAICISSLEKCASKSFAHFLIWAVCIVVLRG